MSDGTVQRFNFGLCDEGCEVDCAHDEFVLASDYDALRTQARELAREVLACHGPEIEPHVSVSMCCSSRECGFVNSEIAKRNAARVLAQAVLKEGA